MNGEGVWLPTCPYPSGTRTTARRRIVCREKSGDVARNTAISNDSTSSRQGKSRRLDQTA